ncbi:MAG: hypothetical protein ACRCZA_10605 [Shewanella sp.]|uniref:hypothetical protein n=1 Tax=Shewanella sp. TaxID=50422 RepID=UPI003F3CC2A1
MTWSKFQNIPVPFAARDLFTQRDYEAKAKFLIINGEKFCPRWAGMAMNGVIIQVICVVAIYLVDIYCNLFCASSTLLTAALRAQSLGREEPTEK